ncbi:hypothetical protein DSECCO2_604850 [anaerobic digester metagenome]
MIFDWKERIIKECDQSIFELYSETERLNIDPQIFAGNLLFDRGYDVVKLQEVRQRLISTIEDNYSKKFPSDENLIRKENTIRQIFIRLFLSAGNFLIFYFLFDFEYKIEKFSLDNENSAYFFAVIHLIPLFWLKSSNRKAIRKARKEFEYKNRQIQKLRTELKF